MDDAAMLKNVSRRLLENEFSAIVERNFQAPKLVLRDAIREGVAGFNDAGEVGIFEADGNFVPLPEKPEKVIKELRRKYAEFALTEKVTDEKSKTRAEVDAMPLDQQAKFFADGGRIQ